MVEGRKRYDPEKVDIWSCGVILFCMMCGYLPFNDPDTYKLYKKIISGNFIIPEFISSEGKNLLRGMLTVDPKTRLTIS